MAVAVSTPVFEGPFDLLLHLITREQVDIYEVPLVRIVDAYLAEIERMEALDLEIATEFLLIAATLVELKLRRLLPGRSDVILDDELALLSERDLLIAKLLEYQTFREAAERIRVLEAAASRSWPRTAGPGEEVADLVPDALARTSAEELRLAYAAVLRRALAPPAPAPSVSLDHLHLPRVTVAEVIDELARVLPAIGAATLRDLTEGRTRSDVVAVFLALLELYKQGWVDLEQERAFGALLVVWQPDGHAPGLDGAGPSASAITVDDAAGEAEAQAAAPEASIGTAPGTWTSVEDGGWFDEAELTELAAFDAELDRLMAAVPGLADTGGAGPSDHLDAGADGGSHA